MVRGVWEIGMGKIYTNILGVGIESQSGTTHWELRVGIQWKCSISPSLQYKWISNYQEIIQYYQWEHRTYFIRSFCFIPIQLQSLIKNFDINIIQIHFSSVFLCNFSRNASLRNISVLLRKRLKKIVSKRFFCIRTRYYLHYKDIAF